MAMNTVGANMGFLQNKQEVSNILLQYWTDFAQWIRMLYVSTMYGLGNREPVLGRLRQNANDFTDIIRAYYGDETSDKYSGIVTDLYSSLFEISDALYRQDAQACVRLNDALYDGIDEMVALLKSINSHIDEEGLRKWLYELLYLTLEEAVMIYAGEYEESVRQSDKILDLSAVVAEEIAYRLISQLQIRGFF